MVRVDDPEPADVRVTLGGLEELDNPEGVDETERLTVPANPFRLYNWTVAETGDPASVER